MTERPRLDPESNPLIGIPLRQPAQGIESPQNRAPHEPPQRPIELQGSAKRGPVIKPRRRSTQYQSDARAPNEFQSYSDSRTRQSYRPGEPRPTGSSTPLIPLGDTIVPAQAVYPDASASYTDMPPAYEEATTVRPKSAAQPASAPAKPVSEPSHLPSGSAKSAPGPSQLPSGSAKSGPAPGPAKLSPGGSALTGPTLRRRPAQTYGKRPMSGNPFLYSSKPAALASATKIPVPTLSAATSAFSATASSAASSSAASASASVRSSSAGSSGSANSSACSLSAGPSSLLPVSSGRESSPGPSRPLKRLSSTKSVRSVGSHKSIRSISGRARYVKAAHDAKHASYHYTVANRGKHLTCYTCGLEFVTAHCQACQTTYVPPDFKYNASAVALFGQASDLHGSAARAPESVQPFSSAASVSSASVSGASASGATMFLGFYPEDEEQEPRNKLDLELVADLALCNESGLLEAVLFECFCSLDSVVEAFGLTDGQEDVCGVDSVKIKHLYDSLSTMTSTAPIRGILQGAQCVLQNRKHEQLSSSEFVYICVILLCPAVVDCSMFTKITGPTQKLSKYASLRARARVLLEVCSGLIGHASEELHAKFMLVFAEQDLQKISELVDLCNGYISHRLSFDYHYKSGKGLQPSKFELVKHSWYADDWRIAVVVKLMALLFGANALLKGAKVPLPHFYNTMLDLVDLKGDFEAWQASKKRFTFAQYPFLLSVGSKSQLLAYAVQRDINQDIQRDLFAYLTNRDLRHTEARQNQFIASLRTVTFHIRRSHLFDDSLEQVLKWPAPKKRLLKVEFDGEPGIDAGGLKREWFLMFYRGFFEPQRELFVEDDTSNYCWFSHTANQDLCRAAGRTLALALLNSVTIDFNVPLLLFKILLDAPYDLNDIGVLWPDLAQSLQSILDYSEPDFEEAFGLNFTSPDGSLLVPDGDQLKVTSESRDTYVNLIIEYYVNAKGPPLRTFKEAFLSVCGCNAITLFQPEELEHLIHGDREPFDLATLRSVTKYVNFGHRYARANEEPVVIWFWDYFAKLDPPSQARLLQFITAADRPPAAGFLQMDFTIKCMGNDSEYLPVARTCFNQLGLYRYKSRQKLERKLSLAIQEYRGFGLK